MKETLAQVTTPHFVAGLVLWGDRCVEAADVIRYMALQRWSRERIRDYCERQGWRVEVVHVLERPEAW